KPNPFWALNHFTVPASSTVASVESGARPAAGGYADRRGAGGDAVLLSTLRTSVTCGPFCPGATRISSVSPACTAVMPLRSSPLAWRNASPEPSVSSTNPKPLSGLNHLTTARTGGPDGASKIGRAHV